MRALYLVPLVLIASCSQSPERSANSAEGEALDAAPGIAVTAAPGVAFDYRYAFRLPNAKIAGVQEAHAQMCEKLGVARCRITGMRYRLEDDRDISAMLAFKLDPAIARNFGKQAIASVDAAEGMLVDSEITGVDAGAAVQTSDRNSAQLRDELARVERDLGRKGLSASERAQLQGEGERLRTALRGENATRDDARASIATTPMVFNYGSGNLIPGFDGSSPVRDATRTAWRSFMTMISFIIIAFGALLPWALLVGAIGWAANRVRRWRPKDAAQVEAVA